MSAPNLSGISPERHDVPPQVSRPQIPPHNPGSSSWIVLVCLLVWLHGASFGATLGDGVLKPLFVLTIMFFGPIFAVWSFPAARRLLVAFLYFLTSSYVMALISSLAWFRNPAHLPPLPDIVHDLIPEVKHVDLPFWHKEPHLLPDLFISGLSVATIIFILFHRHRWIILRRFFVIYGTLMCMRSVTIVVTNLPDALPKCHEITRFHHWNQINARWVVLRAVKLLVPVGEMTCGDMVFSGHSMILCLEAMIWHTYYKRAPGLRFNYVKLAVWACVIMGLFSILAVRLHYTLDVILAVYFSITVWSAYHRIAHDVAVGHHFSMIWLIDHVFIYPTIRWLETPLDVKDVETSHEDTNSQTTASLPLNAFPGATPRPTGLAMSGPAHHVDAFHLTPAMPATAVSAVSAVGAAGMAAGVGVGVGVGVPSVLSAVHHQPLSASAVHHHHHLHQHQQPQSQQQQQQYRMGSPVPHVSDIGGSQQQQQPPQTSEDQEVSASAFAGGSSSTASKSVTLSPAPVVVVNQSRTRSKKH